MSRLSSRRILVQRRPRPKIKRCAGTHFDPEVVEAFLGAVPATAARRDPPPLVQQP